MKTVVSKDITRIAFDQVGTGPPVRAEKPEPQRINEGPRAGVGRVFAG